MLLENGTRKFEQNHFKLIQFTIQNLDSCATFERERERVPRYLERRVVCQMNFRLGFNRFSGLFKEERQMSSPNLSVQGTINQSLDSKLCFSLNVCKQNGSGSNYARAMIAGLKYSLNANQHLPDSPNACACELFLLEPGGPNAAGESESAGNIVYPGTNKTKNKFINL